MQLDNSINKKLWDVLLTEALLEDSCREIKQLEADTQEHDFSAVFNHDIGKVRRTIGRKHTLKSAIRKSIRVLSSAAAVLGVAFCVIMLQPDVRAAVINEVWSPETSDKDRLSFYFEGVLDGFVETKNLTYIPEGYEFADLSANPYGVFIQYIKYDSDYTDDKICFSYNLGGGDAVISTGEYVYKPQTVDGIEYHIYYNLDDRNPLLTCFWQDGDYVYNISGRLTVEEFFRMAESVE
ncbi:MAG: DUF4367 domain-containing protein [Oscillospiraceae bacterium]|nr:DUF4367 domain-containing protein [Oscillospiraceae bacterium]